MRYTVVVVEDLTPKAKKNRTIADDTLVSIEDDHDDVVRTLLAVEHLSGLVRLALVRCREQTVEWCQKHGDLQVSPTKRYYAGTRRETKARQKLAVLEAVLEATEGDLESFSDAMSSQPFKAGHCRTLLGDDLFDELFETTVKDVMKDGVPQKTLLQADDRFVGHKKKGLSDGRTNSVSE